MPARLSAPKELKIPKFGLVTTHVTRCNKSLQSEGNGALPSFLRNVSFPLAKQRGKLRGAGEMLFGTTDGSRQGGFIVGSLISAVLIRQERILRRLEDAIRPRLLCRPAHHCAAPGRETFRCSASAPSHSGHQKGNAHEGEEKRAAKECQSNGLVDAKYPLSGCRVRGLHNYGRWSPPVDLLKGPVYTLEFVLSLLSAHPSCSCHVRVERLGELSVPQLCRIRCCPLFQPEDGIRILISRHTGQRPLPERTRKVLHPTPVTVGRLIVE